MIIYMAELKPFTALLASLLAGVLVSGHIIDPANRQPVQDLLDTFFGGLIVLGTVAAAIHRYVIPHNQTTSTTTTATVQQTSEQPAVDPAPQAEVQPQPVG